MDAVGDFSVFARLHRAVPVMPVMAEIGRDEDKICRRRFVLQVLRQLVEIDHVPGALAAIDQRMEVDEGIVARGVLIAARERLGSLRVVEFVQGDLALRVERLTAGRLLAFRVQAHVFHIAAPGPAGGGELIGKRLKLGGVNAPGADRLTVRGDPGEFEIIIEGTIDVRLHGRRLAAEHGDVVVQADMPGAVVLAEQHALARQGLRQELGGRILLGGRTERRVKAFVLEHDDEDMADPAVSVAVITVARHRRRRCRERSH